MAEEKTFPMTLEVKEKLEIIPVKKVKEVLEQTLR